MKTELINRLTQELDELGKEQAFTQSEQGVEICTAHCAEHGAFSQRVRKLDLGVLRRTTYSQCPHCVAQKINAKKAELESVKAQAKVANLQKLRSACAIPKRFEQLGFEQFNVTTENHNAERLCKGYAQRWERCLSNGTSLILHGKPGTGKTFLAAAIANFVMEHFGAKAKWTTAIKLTRAIKGAWNGGNETAAMGEFIRPDLLIIDEVGVQFGTETEKLILFEIINERYETVKPTIIISNFEEHELADYIGERVLDRMRENNGAVISFNWGSYRK